MANLTMLLWLTCLVGILYAGRLFEKGRVYRYLWLKRTIERKLLPAMVICELLTIFTK